MTATARTRADLAEREAQREREHAELIALIDEREPGEIPCRAQGIAASYGWTSDDPDERALAALACSSCPTLAPCRDYGIRWPSELGVYGGWPQTQREKEANQ